MEKRTRICLDGILDASMENQELIVTEFNESDGVIEEEYYDLIEVLDSYDGKRVRLMIEVEE